MNVGIIGLGDMGKMYALGFSKAGYPVYGSDLPERRDELNEALNPHGITILEDGKEVSRICDVIFYAVESEKIEQVLAMYGSSTKYGAIVAGQTSVKHPEIVAFEKYLPKDIQIITCHSLHGPGFDPAGQKMIVIPHRTSNEAYQRMTDLLSCLGSELVEMKDYRDHDRIVADTQAATHVGFESMGTAWASAGFFPWENASYLGGIDNVKILTTLRIFSYKAHIYAGLAILNPFARQQVKRYAQSESELFKMMIMEEEKTFRERLYKVRDFVFHESRKPLLLDDQVMQEFSLSSNPGVRKANSHLSLLSMADAWYHLQINPYDNLICQTPPFRLRLGIVEYLFRNEALLEESIHAALFDKSIRADDLEFHSAVREWTSIIGYGDMEGYKQHFDQTKLFFKDRLEHGREQSSAMIKRLTDQTFLP
ncbi:prephenate dehydrogenase/arogenate dehydrogenase family protein [Pedobacter sp. KBW06]|uniref:prephenate dehydrogenase n=1 Tax=Pedobacter sp. KBW06 TaxID=2153359 RepID=UPI000F59C04F|nr:prephenate dehydrogenase [Pedobacter sp. KBW06]RQO66126.1 prephenate dehydrogenase/arogenate dehydrogenase family protein [Pedobacter sp. KBW06]